MKYNKIFIGIILSFFLVLQVWFAIVTFSNPFLGISVVQNENSKWKIVSFDDEKNAMSNLKLQLNDVILSVNGIEADEHFSIKKWHGVEQAHNLVIHRDGKELTINLESVMVPIIYTLIPLGGGLACQFFALILFIRLKNSNSIKYLSLLFVAIGGTFISLGASVRGDSFGKYFIETWVMAVPLIFLEALSVFFKEKCNIIVLPRFRKVIYYIAFIVCIIKTSYLIPNPYNYLLYRINVNVTLIVLLIGIILVFYILASIYLKYRKEKSHISTIIKTVWLALIVSFMPLVFLFALPYLFTGEAILNGTYSGWFILIFPLPSVCTTSTSSYDVCSIQRCLRLCRVRRLWGSLL